MQARLLQTFDTLKRVLEMIDLNTLPTNAELAKEGRDPEHNKQDRMYIEELAQEIEDKGQLSPIAIAQYKDGTRHLKAGRARTMALRLMGRTQIMSQVFIDADDISDADWIVADNMVHKANDLATFHAVSQYVHDGMNMEELKRVTHLPKQELEKIMSISHLDFRFHTAIEEGKLTMPVAQMLAALKPIPAQLDALADEMAKKGRITGEMVHDVRNVRKQALIKAQLTPTLLAPPPMIVTVYDFMIQISSTGEFIFYPQETVKGMRERLQPADKLFRLVPVF